MDKNKIKVLVVEPQKQPYVKEIEKDYRAMQAIVGGRIEYAYLSDDAHIYCNEEGKLLGLEWNRKLENRDIIAGTFFICSDDGYGDDISLTDEQIEKYTERFKEPEQFSYSEINQQAESVVVESAYSVKEFLNKIGLLQEDEDLER